MDGWTWDFCLEAEVCSQLSYRSSHPFSGQGGKARNGEAVQGLQCVQGGKMCFHKACSQAASNSTLFVWVKGCPAASRVGGWVHGWGGSPCIAAKSATQHSNCLPSLVLLLVLLLLLLLLLSLPCPLLCSSPFFLSLSLFLPIPPFPILHPPILSPTPPFHPHPPLSLNHRPL